MSRQAVWTLKGIEDLINKYFEREGATMTTIEEGVLGYGKVVLKAPNCKTAIVTEQPTSSWSSVHRVRMYRVCPKKYENY